MSTPDWRLQPLRNFWQNVNWENRTIAPVSISSTNNGNAAILSLMMSVREYFQGISWAGIPEIADLPPDAKPISSSLSNESNETLEDFLDDISKFF
jgi:hypothetical protein